MVWLDGRKLETDVSGLMAEAGRLAPVLPFDVIHNGALRPCEQSRDNESGPFAAASWREGQDVFGTIMFQVMEAIRRVVVPAADVNAGFAFQKRSVLDVLLRSPASRAVQVVRIL